MNILDKIEKAKLTGRGGAGFPTSKKWKMVKEALDRKKYVVCNASEGEPDIKKDFYILEKYPEKVFAGMHLASEFLGAEKAILYLNSEYYDKLYPRLKKLAWDYSIEFYRKPHQAGYIGGEETSVINTLEGKRTEPRLRPPFPTTNGYFGHPTLVNNVETFYAAALINEDIYKNTRFYTIAGDVIFPGVYEFGEYETVKSILDKTHNYPNFDFFAQTGGGASGEIINQKQLEQTVGGGGSITIYSQIKYDPLSVMKKWVYFFQKESCGQCTPCREGTYRLKEILNKGNINWKQFSDIVNTLSDTSFCGLGCAVAIPISSFIKNVLPYYANSNINLNKSDIETICKYF